MERLFSGIDCLSHRAFVAGRTHPPIVSAKNLKTTKYIVNPKTKNPEDIPRTELQHFCLFKKLLLACLLHFFNK